MRIFRTFHLVAAVTLIMASLAGGSPVVTISTTPNIGGSGFEAIDFYYASSAGADFTNYRLNLETAGGYIYDPLRKESQNTGGNSIDTYMNTVGSYLGISDATHIQSVYKATGPSTSSSPITLIDWSVFDTLSGDSNAIEGYAPGPYHMARVLVSPGAEWNAFFEAYDTFSNATPAIWRFSNNSPLGSMDPIAPPTPAVEEPPVLPPTPVAPPLVTPHPQPAPGTAPPDNPPVSTGPPDNSIPIVPMPDVPFVEHPIDPLTWDPVNPSQPYIGLPEWRFPIYWESYQPFILDATDPDTIVPIGIDHDGYTVLTATGIAPEGVHLNDEDGMYSYQPMTYFAMFDGAVESNASILTDVSSFAPRVLTFGIAGQDLTDGQFNNASDTPEPTAALLASVALASCAQLLARRRRV